MVRRKKEQYAFCVVTKIPNSGSGEQDDHRDSTGGIGMGGMTDFTLRQLQRKLEKEKTETEWKLKEYGWRLDQASAVSPSHCQPTEDNQCNVTITGLVQS